MRIKMSQTNKTLLIQSSSQQFQSGPQIEDPLLPTPWSTVKDQYWKQLRKQQLPTTFDWGTENHSVILPRSLNCLSNIYLRVDLPALSDPSHVYKNAVGKYIINSMTFRSNGQEVYRINNYPMFIRNYEENLTVEELESFRDTFMGGHTAQRSQAARTCFIPLGLPHTRYARYAHSGNHQFGVLPARFGTSVTEISVTLNNATSTVLDAAHVPGSIQNRCSLEFREIVGRSAFQNSYSEGRGSYSVCLPEKIELTADFVNCSAGVKHTFKNLSCTGNVFCLEFYTQDQADEVHQENDVQVPLTFLEVRLDNEVVICLNDEMEVKLDNYAHGYKANNGSLTTMARVQFNNLGTKASISFRGALDFRSIQSLDVEVAFKTDCKVRVYSRRYSRIVLTAQGEFKKYLD